MSFLVRALVHISSCSDKEADPLFDIETDSESGNANELQWFPDDEDLAKDVREYSFSVGNTQTADRDHGSLGESGHLKNVRVFSKKGKLFKLSKDGEWMRKGPVECQVLILRSGGLTWKNSGRLCKRVSSSTSRSAADHCMTWAVLTGATIIVEVELKDVMMYRSGRSIIIAVHKGTRVEKYSLRVRVLLTSDRSRVLIHPSSFSSPTRLQRDS